MNDKKITSSIIFAYVGSGANVDVLKFSHEKGLFKKHGVDMTPIYVADGVLSTQAVISGRASAATAPVTDVIAAIAKGAPLKIIMVNIDRFDYLFMAKAGINDLADLRGKKIAVSRKGSVSDTGTRFFLRQFGLDPDIDVQFLHLGKGAARAAALSGGLADSAAVTSSFVPSAKKAGFNVIFDMSATQAKFANRSVVASDRLIKDQRHVVKAIVAGFVEGTRSWKANPVEAKAYLKRLNKLPDPDIESIYSETCKFMRSEPTPDLDGIQNAWQSIPGHQPLGIADFRKFVDARFVGEVLKEMK
jgi:ABC-type nitrate/sulfonate/bicarbonate transport system substrate-binding protein